jgi:hypothetical protein
MTDQPAVSSTAQDGQVASRSEDTTADAPVPGTPKPLSRRRIKPPYLIVAALTVLVILAANGAWYLYSGGGQADIAVAEPQESLRSKIDDVVAGKTDSVEMISTPVTDQQLSQLDDAENLRVLVLDAGEVTDQGIAQIAKVSKLVHLRIRNSTLTDASLDDLAKLKNLRVLNLPQAKFSKEGVARLADLPNLRQLRLGGDGITDVSKSVAQITRLRSLHLINVPVTDDGLRALATMPNLESLYLDDSRVTEVGWNWLFVNHPELHVHVNQEHHDRDPNRHRHDTPTDPNAAE